jgi:hypothetical protein
MNYAPQATKTTWLPPVEDESNAMGGNPTNGQTLAKKCLVHKMASNIQLLISMIHSIHKKKN